MANHKAERGPVILSKDLGVLTQDPPRQYISSRNLRHRVTKGFPGCQRYQTSFLPDQSRVRDLFDLATIAQMSRRRAICPKTEYRQCAGSLPGAGRLRAMNPTPG